MSGGPLMVVGPERRDHRCIDERTDKWVGTLRRAWQPRWGPFGSGCRDAPFTGSGYGSGLRDSVSGDDPADPGSVRTESAGTEAEEGQAPPSERSRSARRDTGTRVGMATDTGVCRVIGGGCDGPVTQD